MTTSDSGSTVGTTSDGDSSTDSDSGSTETTGDPDNGLVCDPVLPEDPKDHGVCLTHHCTSSPGSGESCKGINFAWSDFFDHCVEIEVACDDLEFDEVGSSDNLPELPDALSEDQIPTARCWLEAMRDDRAAALKLVLAPGTFENLELDLRLDGRGRMLAREFNSMGGGYHSYIDSMRTLASPAHYQACLDGTPSEMLDCIMGWSELACETMELACDADYCHGPECMVETWRLGFERRFSSVFTGSWLYIVEMCFPSDLDWCGENPGRLSVYSVDGTQEPMLENTVDIAGAMLIIPHEAGLLIQTADQELLVYHVDDPANPEFSATLEAWPPTMVGGLRVVFSESEVALFDKDSADGDHPLSVIPGAYSWVEASTDRWLGLRAAQGGNVHFFDIRDPRAPMAGFTFPSIDDDHFWFVSMHDNRLVASFGEDFVVDMFSVDNTNTLTLDVRHRMRNPYVTAHFTRDGDLQIASMRRSSTNFHKDFQTWRFGEDPRDPLRLHYHQRDVETAVEMRSGHIHGGTGTLWEDAEGIVIRDGTELYRLSTAECANE